MHDKKEQIALCSCLIETTSSLKINDFQSETETDVE